MSLLTSGRLSSSDCFFAMTDKLKQLVHSLRTTTLSVNCVTFLELFMIFDAFYVCYLYYIVYYI